MGFIEPSDLTKTYGLVGISTGCLKGYVDGLAPAVFA